MAGVKGKSGGFRPGAGLTPKREKFAQAIASGMNQSDAYRAAFDVKPGSKANSINVNASKMMADAKVALRVEELRAPAVERAGITLESHLADLKSLRNMAAKAGQIAAAVAAEVARGKAAGVLAADRLELTGKGGAPVALTAVSPDEYRRIAADIAAKT